MGVGMLVGGMVGVVEWWLVWWLCLRPTNNMNCHRRK